MTPETVITQIQPPWWAKPFAKVGAVGIVALLAIIGLGWFVKADREDRVAERAAFVKVMDAQATAMHSLAGAVRENTQADSEMRAVWRALYAPAIPPDPRRNR